MLRKCADCGKSIELTTENYFTEQCSKKKIYRHHQCGKRFMDYPREAILTHQIRLHIHFGTDLLSKSMVIHDLPVDNADFPEESEILILAAVPFDKLIEKYKHIILPTL